MLSTTGGLAREATTFYMFASKLDQTCSTLRWLRFRLAISLLRSSIPGHQRCKIIVWTFHQNVHDGRPDYNSESQLTSLYIALVYFLFLPAFILFLLTNCICFLLKKRFLLQSTPATQRLLSSGNDWAERKFISLPNS